jgi:hypothetical protein
MQRSELLHWVPAERTRRKRKQFAFPNLHAISRARARTLRGSYLPLLGGCPGKHRPIASIGSASRCEDPKARSEPLKCLLGILCGHGVIAAGTSLLAA